MSDTISRYPHAGIPVHPQPGFFETTIVEAPTGTIVTPQDALEIMSRPKWDFAEAEARVFADRFKKRRRLGKREVGRKIRGKSGGTLSVPKQRDRNGE